MTTQEVDRPPARPDDAGPAASRVSGRAVLLRRVTGALLVVVPIAWALQRAVPGGTDLVNRGGLALLDDLLATALAPELDQEFLALVVGAAWTTVVFAALGTLGTLVIGVVGGLVLSDIAWSRRVPWPVRMLRLGLRGLFVAVRSIHELVWALLLVSVLGLDPLVAVLAIAIPFGAQTAKVFAEILDGVPAGPLTSLRSAGAKPGSALAYALVPGAAPLLLSYSFYRFECAIRSVVLLGVVGLGGLGQELVVSLQSRNWSEVWTLVGAVLVLSAIVDLWSTKVRSALAVVTCSDWSGGQEESGQAAGGTSWMRWSAALLVPGIVVAWIASGVSLAGLTSERTRALTGSLLGDMWPPALPAGGWPALWSATIDTVAMAVLAMAVAVVVTAVVGPWATRPRLGSSDERRRGRGRWFRWIVWWLSRAVLLVLRSIPPTIWAVVALLAIFPGILPGALALGLYTGGILGRLVAEAWESVDTRPREALRHAGVRNHIATMASVTPASAHHLVTYTLYRFEICVRDTAVVGVVGAAGLGRLLAENLAVFRFPVVASLLLASFAVSVATELVGRRLRRALRA